MAGDANRESDAEVGAPPAGAPEEAPDVSVEDVAESENDTTVSTDEPEATAEVAEDEPVVEAQAEDTPAVEVEDAPEAEDAETSAAEAADSPETEAEDTPAVEDTEDTPAAEDTAAVAETPKAEDAAEPEPVLVAAGATPPAAEPEEPSRRRRWPLVTALVVLFALMVSAGAIAGSTVSYADSLEGRLLPGTSIAGVDVGSMTHRQALQAVRGVLADELDRTMVVRWRGQRWTTTARELGARNNAKRIIQSVAESQTGLDWQDWARMRWLDERTDIAADVRVKYRREAVRAFIDSVADDIDAEPVDAELSVEGDTISVSPSAVGYRTERKLATDRLFDRLRGSGRKVTLKVDTLKPEVNDDAYDQVLLLDQSEHKLSLHLDGTVAQTWTVAVGTGDHPTPLGQYSVTEKRYMPTWVNPSPDDWGKDMPAEIPPGENNPLGLRALNWSAPAIRFHGTQAIDSLGTDASHGCVRMSNGDVIELYDMVDVGAVIISRT